MASRRLALVGAGDGPWIDISRVPHPALRVSGHREGKLKVVVKPASGSGLPPYILEVVGDALHDLLIDGAEWLRVSNGHKGVICEVVSRA